MARLRYSAAAKDDIASIAEYIARESTNRSIAERFAGELRGKCRDLAASPIQMGRPRTELRRDLRSHPYTPGSREGVGRSAPWACTAAVT